jgi:hypothetical protein
MINVGIDFTVKKQVLSGSFDYYWRRGNDLMGNMAMDPTSGIAYYKDHVAAMKGSGFDLSLKSQVNLHPIRWHINLQLGFTTHTLLKAGEQPLRAWDYVNADALHLREGYSTYALFSFPWGGLSHEYGDPQGYLNGNPSNRYDSIFDAPSSTLIHHGSTIPRYFGSIEHLFRYKQFEFSIMLAGKFDYYFRQPSIHYSNLFNQVDQGDPDYAQRWKKPGDELYTNVPSMQYPANPLRDQFYAYSSSLVEKGDHIRVREIRLGWDMPKTMLPWKTKACNIYGYVSNPWLVYKANDAGIDPDALNFIPSPASITFGAKLIF